MMMMSHSDFLIYNFEIPDSFFFICHRLVHLSSTSCILYGGISLYFNFVHLYYKRSRICWRWQCQR